jgi:hypothetical protein
MLNQHPITPPPELVHQWVDMLSSRSDQAVFTMTAQWGADRNARRPKPPSLKEQALNDLDDIPTHDDEGRQVVDLSNIRRALEALND